MRRNRGLVASIGVICLAVVTGSIVAVTGYREARASEREAREAESLAEERLAEEQAVAEFVSNLLYGESLVTHSSVTYVQLLERAVDLLKPELFPNPERWRDLQRKVAAIYANRGEVERAIYLLEEVHEYEVENALPSKGFGELAWCYRRVGREVEALELRRKTYTYWKNRTDAEPGNLLSAIGGWIDSLIETGEREEIVAVTDEAWALFNEQNSADLDTLRNLAAYFRDADQDDRAIAVYQFIVTERTKERGSTDWVTLNDSCNLASTLFKAEQYRAAMNQFTEIRGAIKESLPLTGDSAIIKNLDPSFIQFRLTMAKAKLPLELLSEGREFLAAGEKQLARECLLLALVWELNLKPYLAVTEDRWGGLGAFLQGLNECGDGAPDDPGAFSLIEPASTWATYCGVGYSAAPDSEWNQADFDASAWREAKAPLGYGDESLATEIWEVQTGETTPTTVYARKEFEVGEIESNALLMVRIRFDDGAALYLNGSEVARLRLPDGPLHSVTLATSSVHGKEEASFRSVVIDQEVLQPGSYLLAVEVHQVSLDSSDVIFDLELLWFPLDAKKLVAELAGFDPGLVLERMRAENATEMEPLPSFAPALAAAQVLALIGEWEEALRRTEPSREHAIRGSDGAKALARFRFHCLQALGRLNEAWKELALGVPERSAEAQPRHLDLSNHYTAYLDEPIWAEGHDDYLRLPATALCGVIDAGSISFDVRGVLHLNCRPRTNGNYLLGFPTEVKGIAVNARVKELHFLHAISGNGFLEPNSKEKDIFASYLINYADGAVIEIPVRERFDDINASVMTTERAERWYSDGGILPTWQGPGITEFSQSTVLYVKSWTNPRPQAPVRSIDVVSSEDSESALMLFGITAEPYPDPEENQGAGALQVADGDL